MRGHWQHIVATASNKKFSLTSSLVVTRRHAEEFGTVYIDWNSLKTRVRARAGKLRGEGFGIIFLTLLCERTVRVTDGCGGRGKRVGGRKVTKGWRDRSATRMIVEGYSRTGVDRKRRRMCRKTLELWERRDWISGGGY